MEQPNKQNDGAAGQRAVHVRSHPTIRHPGGRLMGGPREIGGIPFNEWMAEA